MTISQTPPTGEAVLPLRPRLPPTSRSRYPGEFFHLLARDHKALFGRLQAAGDVAQVRMGLERIVLLSHPDDIRQMLVTEQRAFIKGRGLELVKTLLGEGLLTSEGEFHLHQRRLVQPAFHRDRVAAYAAVMVEYAHRTAASWKDEQILDVHQEMMRLTRDIAGTTLFDLHVGEDPGGIEDAIALSLKMYRLRVLPLGSLLEWLPLPFVRRVHAARARLNAWLVDTIRQRRAEGVDRGDLLSMFLAAEDPEDPSGPMSDQQVRDELVTLLLAGHETTAVALSWTWYLLSRNPLAEVRLHAELSDVLGGRLPTAADVGRLVYTRMVFCEAMRLYPPAWMLERRAVQDIRVGGGRYLIPAGSLVYASPYLVHRDPRWYPDPTQFDPERWRPERVVERPKFAYFPFGAGTRVCVGEQFAWMEGILVLATIAQRWRLRHDPTHTVAVEPLVTLRPKYGMRMRVLAG